MKMICAGKRKTKKICKVKFLYGVVDRVTFTVKV